MWFFDFGLFFSNDDKFLLVLDVFWYKMMVMVVDPDRESSA